MNNKKRPHTLALAVSLLAAWTALSPASAGQVGGESNRLLQLLGTNLNSGFGSAVAGAGDVDGDGRADIVVGAPFGRFNGYVYGAAYVYSGATGQLLHRFLGDEHLDQFGYSVAGAGDVNTDGYDDILVGAISTETGGWFPIGSAYVFSGLDGSLIRRVNGPVPYSSFGASVAGAGDVDQDGADDWMVGAIGADPWGALDAGSVFVYSGMSGSLLYRFHGESAGDQLGSSIAGGVDVNLDGVPDFLMATALADPNGLTDAGTAYVYSGADGTLLHRIDGEAQHAAFGNAIGATEDLNGDGAADLLIAQSAKEVDGNSLVGSVHVYSGADGSLLRVLDGMAAGDQFGDSVAGAGDVDGDGYGDYLVGAPQSNLGGSQAGYACLYSGATGALLRRFDGEDAGDQMGSSVAAAGDVDGDGHGEVVLGATGVDFFSVGDAGAAFVWDFRPYLRSSSYVASAALGTRIDLEFDFPESAAGQEYRLLFSASGIGPFVRGVAIPLTQDQLLLDTFHGLYPFTSHSGLQGNLDARGKASGSFKTPANLPPYLLGRSYHMAAVVLSMLGPVQPVAEYSSIAIPLEVVP